MDFLKGNLLIFSWAVLIFVYLYRQLCDMHRVPKSNPLKFFLYRWWTSSTDFNEIWHTRCKIHC